MTLTSDSVTVNQHAKHLGQRSFVHKVLPWHRHRHWIDWVKVLRPTWQK